MTAIVVDDDHLFHLGFLPCRKKTVRLLGRCLPYPRMRLAANEGSDLWPSPLSFKNHYNSVTFCRPFRSNPEKILLDLYLGF